jgi:hypothetical protein
MTKMMRRGKKKRNCVIKHCHVGNYLSVNRYLGCQIDYHFYFECVE